MNKILALFALIGAFSFLPVQTASARCVARGHGCHVVAHRGHVGHVVRAGRVYRHGVVHGRGYGYYGPGYVYRRGPILGVSVLGLHVRI